MRLGLRGTALLLFFACAPVTAIACGPSSPHTPTPTADAGDASSRPDAPPPADASGDATSGDATHAGDAPSPTDADAGAPLDAPTPSDAPPVFDADASNAADASDSDASVTDASVTDTLLGTGPTDGTLNGADLGVDLSGTGTAPIGTVAITGGHGTVEIDGTPVAAFVVEHQAISIYQLYETVAVAPDRMTIFWFYCNTGALDSEYWEVRRGLANGATESSGGDPAAGTCTEHLGAASVPVTLPALSFPAPPAIADITIAAAGLTYDGVHPGTLVAGGVTYGLYPFHHVDCRACATPGWQEVHTFLADPTAATLSFGIVYLFPAAANRQTQLSYTTTLPTLATIPDTSFAGTWTGPPGTTKSRPSRLLRPLPPDPPAR